MPAAPAIGNFLIDVRGRSLLWWSATNWRLRIATRPPCRQASVCDIQAEPGTFYGKEVVVRGKVYAGVDVTNISDPQCPGQAVQLTVAERISGHRDIRSFERGLRVHGMRAVATLTGRFQAKAPTHPFPMPAIDVHAVQSLVFEAK